jgi:hypothetical protein
MRSVGFVPCLLARTTVGCDRLLAGSAKFAPSASCLAFSALTAGTVSDC